MKRLRKATIIIGIIIITIAFLFGLSGSVKAGELAGLIGERFTLTLSLNQDIVSYLPQYKTVGGIQLGLYCVEKHADISYANGITYEITQEVQIDNTEKGQKLGYMIYKRGKVDKAVQVAIWLDKQLNHNNDAYDDPSYQKTAQALLDEAKAFLDFQKEVKAGTIFKDKTNYKDVKWGYDYTTKSYIVGPFEMEYKKYEIGKVVFSKLTNMKLYQHTIDGKQATDFSFVRSSNAADTTYPESGEKFYVKFKGINDVRKVSLSATMWYIKGYTGSYVKCYNVRYINDTEVVDTQDIIGIGKIDRVEKEETFYMPGDTNGGGIGLLMKLGGYVWVDEEQGKETIVNGYKDPGEKVLPGVIVTLYKKGEDDKPAVVYDEKNKLVANPRTTDASGYYEFDGLSAGDGDKYYVTFDYDGLNYQDTLFMAGQSGDEANLQNEFGVSPWEKNSKGIENAEQRSAINATFAKIGSYPENYKSKTTGKGNTTYRRDDEKLNAVKNTGWTNMQAKMTAGQSLTSKVVKECYSQAAGSGEDGDRMTGFIMDSYIRLKTKFNYPVYDQITPSKTDVVIAGKTYKAIYDGQLRVNQGFYLRPQGDLSLIKDVYNAVVTINGKTHTYEYNSREALMNGQSEYWEVEIRNADAAYTQASYTRTVYGADYQYTAEKYADKGAKESDELEVYVTYKIAVSNRSSTIDMSVDEIVDYYDKDYEVVASGYGTRRSPGEMSGDGFSKTSKYGANTQFSSQASSDGLNAIYFNGPEGKLQPGEVAYLYVKCKVVKENSLVKLDEDGSYKANVAEINGYSTWYSEGTTVPGGKEFKNVGGQVAGVLDKNSTPGNLNKGFRSDTFDENDTDHAPKFYLIRTNEEREIDGVVWEDTRNKEVDSASIGDGINNGEETINGVKVQLVEVKDGTYYVWDEIKTGAGSSKEIIPGQAYNFKNPNGYEFKGYVAGDYFVRFIYGDNYDTVLVKDSGFIPGEDGKNAKSYNGHDYKSTTYQAGMSGYNPTNDDENATLGYTYDIAASEAHKNISDAKDIALRRSEVEAYSNSGIGNELAEKLSLLAGKKPVYYDNTTEYVGDEKPYHLNNKNILDEVISATRMWAETGKINVEVEKNRTTTTLGESTDYQLVGIDFGIEERPKAQLAVDKQVANIKITLANGEVLFDANDTVSNLLWRKGEEHFTGYNGKQMLVPQVRTGGTNGDGVIQATMDSEIMHGAALQATYTLKIRNVGEVDYNDKSFYYKGQLGNRSSIVKTKAVQLIEYVDSNLRYDESKNDTSEWTLMKAEDVMGSKLVGTPLESDVKSFDTILVSAKTDEELVPKIYGTGTSEIQKQVVLTQMITSGNSEDDLEYNNTIEIVKTQNTIGRRMAYSIEGNQNPNGEIKEVDADKSETITILPPFGDHKVYYVLGIAIAMVLLTGVVVIKKFVLGKNKIKKYSIE